MLKRLLFAALCGVFLASATWAQEETTRPRTNNPIPPDSVQEDRLPANNTPRPRRTGSKTSRRARSATGEETPVTTAADENGVRATFADLVKAIEDVNVDGVTKLYWKAPQLVMFNRNGSVTKGWEQMRENREASYASVKDVKLTTRDVSVQMLGRDGAVLSCLWTQSQKNDGKFEASSGRMSLVFRRMNNQWRIVHLHTSPGVEK